DAAPAARRGVAAGRRRPAGDRRVLQPVGHTEPGPPGRLPSAPRGPARPRTRGHAGAGGRAGGALGAGARRPAPGPARVRAGDRRAAGHADPPPRLPAAGPGRTARGPRRTGAVRVAAARPRPRVVPRHGLLDVRRDSRRVGPPSDALLPPTRRRDPPQRNPGGPAADRPEPGRPTATGAVTRCCM